MKIAMIGTGYVGLVSGVCFSDFGHDVVCVDKDPEQDRDAGSGRGADLRAGAGRADGAQRGGRAAVVHRRSGAGGDGAEAVFIAVGTPTRRGDGHADLTYVMAAAEEIAARPDRLCGDRDQIHRARRHQPQGAAGRSPRPTRMPDFDVASNPEFLREGAAIDDFMRPDRVVVGVQNDRAAEVMQAIYRPLFLRDFPIVTTDLESAEMIKYAANAFLATKITFINEIAALCERTGADVKEVSKGMGLDGRIGNKFLHAGPGYGGSCFPKDTRALARIGQEHAVPDADHRNGDQGQ